MRRSFPFQSHSFQPGALRARVRRLAVCLLIVCTLLAALPAAWSAEPTVRFRWPVRHQDWNHISNYVDLDLDASMTEDWDCDQVTYDTHAGTDIIIRDFVEQDEGRFALAAADGFVEWVEDGFFDRSTAPNGGPANYVQIRHDDGTQSLYIHLAKWSTLVSAGENVRRGQPVGLIGSSGNSSEPHLHFEVLNADVAYDPYTGPCQPGSSLWDFTQPPHTLDQPLSLFASGLTHIHPWAFAIRQRMPRADHVHQTGGVESLPLYLWLYLADLHVGDQIRMVVRRPDDSVYQDDTQTLTADQAFDWRFFTTFLPQTGTTGLWHVDVYVNGVLNDTHAFTLDTVPYQDPIAQSDTYDVTRGVYHGELFASDADSEIEQYRLLSLPTQGEVRLYGPRQSRFVYVPNGGLTGTDSFTFEAEDGQDAISAPGTVTLNVTARPANVIEFEGEDDNYVDIPGNGSLNLAQLTIEFWVKRTTGSNQWQVLLDNRNPGFANEHGYRIYMQPDAKLVFHTGNGTEGWFAFSDSPLPLDEWVHVAFTYDGTNKRIFFNGIQDGGDWFFAGPISYTGVNGTRVGGSFFAFESFRGQIDEMRIWDGARSAAQIQQGMSCAFFESSPPAALRGLWRFDGDATDASASTNHGALVGTSFFRRAATGIPLDCQIDTDADGQLDTADNCPLDPNVGQVDQDGDGVGDACDVCPATADAAQHDSDLDGVGDACDGCALAANTSQADGDSDGAQDACDPAPGAPGTALPGEVQLSLAHDKGTATTTLSWAADPAAEIYEVFRTDLASLAAGYLYLGCQNTRDGNPADTSFAEDQAPAAGDGFFFVVTGATAGARGPAGLDSDGRARDLRAGDCQ